MPTLFFISETLNKIWERYARKEQFRRSS